MLGVDPIFTADGEFIRIARRGGIVRAIDVRAQRGAALGRGPEFVPLPQRAVVRDRLGRGDGDLAQACSDVDVRLSAERLQIVFDAGILRQRLDECADARQHHRPHFVFELFEFGGRKSFVEPVVVGFEVEFGVADQEI